MSASPPLVAPSLAVLRDELDQIDDALHDLLVRRAEVVERVGALRAKGRVALRPGREAAILHRLLARNRAPLAPELLVRLWRDLLNSSAAQQQALRLAVPDAALVPLARRHFGERAALVASASASAAIGAVATGHAEVAVLGWPGAWWPLLARDGAVKVVARLPFWAEPGGPEALVLTAAEPDPSGADRTLVAAAAEEERWPGALEQAGLRPTAAVQRADGWALAELDGFVGHERLPRAAVIVGAYAVPVGQPA